MTEMLAEKVPGVILAGGLSRRMGGGDKTLRPLAGKPMIDHVIDRLAPQVSLIAINANGDPDRFAPRENAIIADVVGDHSGPLAGILTAMRWAEKAVPEATHVVTAASDSPLFPADLMDRFRAMVKSGRTIVMARSRGNHHPVFALWPIGLAEELESWLETTDTLKVMAWVRDKELVFCDFGEVDDVDPFLNINTPGELAELEAIIEKAAA